MIVSWTLDRGRLSSAARTTIIGRENEVMVGAASVRSLGLRTTRQSLSWPDNRAAILPADGLREQPVSCAHAQRAMPLPSLHGDPCDRLLIAQALTEGLRLVTSDPAHPARRRPGP